MEDVGKSPPASAIAVADSSSFNQLDGWIETLMQCKQLSELDVQRLCEKVRSETGFRCQSRRWVRGTRECLYPGLIFLIC